MCLLFYPPNFLTRYVPALRAVLLTHINTQFKQSAGLIIDESPFSVTDVQFTALVWSPTIGQRMRRLCVDLMGY